VVKISLDTRALEHPQPMEEALKVLETLDDTSYLHMKHRKNPIPLLQLAQSRGYKTLSRTDQDGTWHILFTKATQDLEELLDV